MSGVEPYGPNSTLGTTASGDQLYPGPGNNAFIDRPPVCTSTTPDTPANCVPGIVRGGSGIEPRRSHRRRFGRGLRQFGFIDDHRQLHHRRRHRAGRERDGYPGEFLRGCGHRQRAAVSDQQRWGHRRRFVPAGRRRREPRAADCSRSTSITLSAECGNATNDLPTSCTAGQTMDPLYDATDPTPGGGDTGSVLISPYITPGTVSTTDYNHYSWLRTVEDLFKVSQCAGTATDITLPAGTVCGGLDGQGHLGYAAQVGLTGFGSDVFTAPNGNGFQQVQPPNALPEAPLVIAIPALAGDLVHGRVPSPPPAPCVGAVMDAVVPMQGGTKDRAARPGLSGLSRGVIAAIFAALLAALGFGIYGLADSHHAVSGLCGTPARGGPHPRRHAGASCPHGRGGLRRGARRQHSRPWPS